MEGFKGKVSQFFDLPEDVVLNLPKISMVGNLNLIVENHRGIIKYTPELVKIRVYSGQVIIEGEGLIIESMEEEVISIKGEVIEVGFNFF
ncbi:sporulation protein YqfC [Halonatronum saccharophilum]|uniref:sporulation protein YqfC n=1 Tax=Halonatronum saccharophilum TaxID=150060 RepID=UPI0005586F54|nr:sporulation protein YqfC [Halonatronum saccharophilum]